MQQLALFDAPRKPVIPIDKPAAPFAPGSATSQAAAAAIAPKARDIRQRVLMFIRSRREYGSTDQELCEALDLASDSGRPRRCELVAAGLVTDCGMTRLTKSGHRAIVWRVSPKVNVYE